MQIELREMIEKICCRALVIMLHYGNDNGGLVRACCAFHSTRRGRGRLLRAGVDAPADATACTGTCQAQAASHGRRRVPMNRKTRGLRAQCRERAIALRNNSTNGGGGRMQVIILDRRSPEDCQSLSHNSSRRVPPRAPSPYTWHHLAPSSTNVLYLCHPFELCAAPVASIGSPLPSFVVKRQSIENGKSLRLFFLI